MGRNRYRVRSIENVVDEIEYLIADFGIDFISISDDLFLSKQQTMQERVDRFRRPWMEPTMTTTALPMPTLRQDRHAVIERDPPSAGGMI